MQKIPVEDLASLHLDIAKIIDPKSYIEKSTPGMRQNGHNRRKRAEEKAGLIIALLTLHAETFCDG